MNSPAALFWNRFFPTTRLSCWRSRIISRLRGWKSSWVDDLAQWKERLQRFGVTKIKYDDPSRFAKPYARFFFQAQRPGVPSRPALASSPLTHA